MSEREEVLTYFGWQTCVMGDECCHDECRIPVQMADEISALRSQLAAVQSERAEWENAAGVYEAGMVRAERERDEARRERDEWETMVGTQRLVLEGMHRRAERAERVVEALREPSEAALRGASDVIFAELGFTLGEGKIRRILHYAVEAVEKEAQP